jgi:hypothetical protein
MKISAPICALAVATPFFLAGCVTPGGGKITTGDAGTAATGAAGGATSVGANPTLQRCTETLGTLALDDGREKDWYGSFSKSTQVTTIEPLIRLAVQQSNCFIITSIGNSRMEGKMSAITAKQGGGEFRAGSKQEKGQRTAADYYLEPAIIINDDSTGKMAGALGSIFGGPIGAIAGSVEGKASVVTLSLFDIRSQTQLSISEGNATATNYGAALGAFGGGAAAGLGGFSRTPAGKATVAAFVDAYNNMVISLKNYKAQEVRGGAGKGGLLKAGS